MAHFRHTQNQIEQLQADIPRMPGMHYLMQPKVGNTGGEYIGSIDFDPAKHPTHVIDPANPMQEVTGNPQVRIEDPINPLFIQLVSDYRFSKDDKRIAGMKYEAVSSIVESIESSLPTLDPSETLEVIPDSNPNPESNKKDNLGLVKFCKEALTFVVGDLSHLRGINKFENPSEVLAVRVMHPAELWVPPNIGRYSLGGLIEVDTGNKKQLEAVNNRLAQYNLGVKRSIEATGARVVEIVIDPSDSELINSDSVDRDIAEALAIIAK